MPSHHTDQQVNMQLLAQQGKGEVRGDGGQKKKQARSMAAVGVL